MENCYSSTQAVCSLIELKELAETKKYTNFADPVLDTLQKAIAHKKLSSQAALLWIFLCKEVKFDQGWSLRKSIRTIAEEFGWSKTTTQKAIKELEENFFLLVERKNRSKLNHEANMLSVRFPKSGIELANISKDRQNIPKQNRINTLPVIKTQNETMCGRQDEEWTYSISTRTIDEVQEEPEIPKEALTDPIDQQLFHSEEKLNNLEQKERMLAAAYKTNPKDLELFKKLISCQKNISAIKINIESFKTDRLSTEVGQNMVHRNPKLWDIIKNNTKIILENNKEDLYTTSDTISKNCCLATPNEKTRNNTLDIKPEIISYIKNQIKKYHKQAKISDPKDLVNQIIFAIQKYQFGTTPLHRANICLKKIFQGEWRTPYGYQDKYIQIRQVEEKHNKTLNVIRGTKTTFNLEH